MTRPVAKMLCFIVEIICYGKMQYNVFCCCKNYCIIFQSSEDLSYMSDHCTKQHMQNATLKTYLDHIITLRDILFSNTEIL